MADTNLPPEYQSALDAALRKQKLAQMMQQRALNFAGPAQTGPVASRTSLFSALGNAGLGALGGYVENAATDEATAARKNFETDSLADIGKFQQMPAGQERVNYGQTSKFAGTRELAKTLQAREDARRNALGTVFGQTGDADRGAAAINGLPDPGSRPYKDPVFDKVEDPAKPGSFRLVVKNFDKQGVPHATLSSPGTEVNVNNNLPKEEGKMVVAQIGKNLDERRGKAQAAQDTYTAAGQAVDALENGARAGGGEGYKQALRKVGQAFGVNSPDTAETEQLSMALGQGVLANAAKLRPASDTDLKILGQLVGTINTDPTALTKVLAMSQAMSLRDLKGYHDYANENKQNLNPNIRDLFGGATSGYDLPKTLGGPPAYQMEVVRQLQKQGYDISTLNDPSGQPFPANSTFKIDPTAGFSGVAKVAPVENAPLTPAQLKRYNELKAKYGTPQ